MTLSRRFGWSAEQNAISRRRRELEIAGRALIDLTNSNPTSAGFDLPTELLAEILAEAALGRYEPHPLGLPLAREAVARYLSRVEEVSPEEIVITASTSESYSWLIKLLTEAGDNVVTGVPSYPLLDAIAALEMIELRAFNLDRHHHWQISQTNLSDRIDARTRAIIAIHPNNPTGSLLDPESLRAIFTSGLPVISDEVFLDYPIELRGDMGSLADGGQETLCFALGGLSKTAALPHWKLGWIRIAGDESTRRAAREALEIIGDTYLSVATPVQRALPQILEIAPEIQSLVIARARKNLVMLDLLLAANPSVSRLRVDAGWSVVLRVPSIAGEESLILRLLEAGVIVQPGYFYDFENEGHLVLSLLTDERELRRGVEILLTEIRNGV